MASLFIIKCEPSGSSLNLYFAKVLEINYRPVFSYDVASLIPSKFVDEVRVIVSAVRGLSIEKVGGDLLGTIFHNLIPLGIRKAVAAYYTNVLAAEFLAELSIERPDVKVADLAVGSGGLLVAAYRIKRALLRIPLTQKIHQRIVEEELLGIDVMPFAANVAACHLALQSPAHLTNHVSIAVWDSSDLSPGRIIPAAADISDVLLGQTSLDSFSSGRRTVKGVMKLTGSSPKDLTLKEVDLVIMNPPFTRHGIIPDAYKQILDDRFSDYKQYAHGQLGLYGFFVFLAGAYGFSAPGKRVTSEVVHRAQAAVVKKLHCRTDNNNMAQVSLLRECFF